MNERLRLVNVDESVFGPEGMFENLEEFIKQTVENWNLMRSTDTRLLQSMNGLKTHLAQVESRVSDNADTCQANLSQAQRELSGAQKQMAAQLSTTSELLNTKLAELGVQLRIELTAFEDKTDTRLEGHTA